MKLNSSKYSVIKTGDGTDTLYSKEFEEHCHSLSGAYEETLHYYVTGCEISTIIQKKVCTILEVGTGTGVGYKATIDTISGLQGTTYGLNFITLEKDRELIEWLISKKKSGNTEFPTFQDLTYFKEKNIYQAKIGKNSLTVILGDCRKSLPIYLKESSFSPNAIFQDPFSPKKNRMLWTTEWFTLLKKISNKKTVLTTYSSASSARKSLIKAGWAVRELPGIGQKKTATRAFNEGSTSKEIYEKLKRSPVLALHDKVDSEN